MSWDVIFDLVIKALTFAVSIGAMVVAVIRTRKTEVERRFERGAERMGEHEARIRELERTVEALPSRSELHELDGRLREIVVGLTANQERMSAISAAVQRIEDYLLKSKA